MTAKPYDYTNPPWKSPRVITRRVAALRLQEGWEVVTYLGVNKTFLRSPAGAEPRYVVELPEVTAKLIGAPAPVRQYDKPAAEEFLRACNTAGAYYEDDLVTGFSKARKRGYTVARKSQFEIAWED